MRRRRLQLAAAVVIVLGLGAASLAVASTRNHGHGKRVTGDFRAKLIGFNEVPATSSKGRAELRLTVTDTGGSFQLTYSGLTGPPAAAHIHVGQAGVNGGVSIFFCGGGGQPPCPAATAGTVTGTFTAANVVGPTAQGFPPGDLADVERAIAAGVAYANMHTAQFPGGEIRGQIRRGHGHGHS
jgi:hypothetical protein